MDALAWMLLLLLLFLVVIQVTRHAAAAGFLRKLRLDGLRVETLPEQDAPQWLLETARPQETALATEGFCQRQGVNISLENGPDVMMPALICTLPGEGIGAMLRPQTFETNRKDCHLVFISRLSDGRVLQTMSSEQIEILQDRPDVETEDIEDVAPAALLARHRKRIAIAAARGALAQPIENTAGFATLLQNMQTEGETALRTSGKAFVDSKGALRLRLKTCLSMMPRVLRQLETTAKNARLRAAAPPALDDAESQAEKDWFMYQLAQKIKRARGAAGSAAWLPKLLVMLGSLALFIIALRWTMSWQTAIIIVVALVFHECGHLLGMKLCGYRDTQLLFLPFLGGAAVAHDPLVLAPWKKLAILFLGPLPGIFAGIAMILATPIHGAPGWLREAGILFVVFNLFNLLPILPLDGGQIADVAFVSRAPRLRAVFMAVSGLALVAIGYAFGRSIVFIMLGVFTLLRALAEWKTGSLVARLRKELPAQAGEKTVVSRVLAALRGPEWKQFRPMQKIALAEKLQEQIRRPKTGLGTMALALLCYTSPLWLGLPAAIAATLIRRGHH